ncbi:MAG TPA: hypothetical protein VGP46_06585, partial [Acidimicrobiales bacterium]|nr:hypothetical protein [Acidimicrobiales bacterium]
DTELMTGGTVLGSKSDSPLLEVFDGSKWSSVKVVKSLEGGSLQAVSVDSGTSAWIGGNQDISASNSDDWQLLVDHLAGTKWVAAAPKIPGKNAFLGALASGGTHAWLFATSWAGPPCSSKATLVGYYWAKAAWASVTFPAGFGGPMIGSGWPAGSQMPRC